MRAIISVFDKAGLAEFAQGLSQLGAEMFSTGGTREVLEQAKLTLSDLRVSGFKAAAKHIKMADELIHRQYQTMRHLQKSIDAVDFKSRLIKRMDLELAELEKKAHAIDTK